MTEGPASRADDPFLWDVLQRVPVAVYTTDAEGLVTRFNDAAARLVGRTPRIGGDRWCVTWRLYSLDGRPMAHEDCPMAQALKESRIIRGVEAIAERPDGSRFRFAPHPTPLRNASGAIIGGINMLVERPRDRGADMMPAGDDQARLAVIVASVDALLQKAWAGHRNVPLELSRAVASLSTPERLRDKRPKDAEVSSWDLLTSICVAAQSALLGHMEVELAWQSTAESVPSNMAVPLSILTKELIADACRDAAHARIMLVRVELCRDMGSYVLIVEHDVSTRIGRRNFESALARRLVQQLNGTLRVERRGGVRYVVRMPDPRRLN
jgi:two-component sensor histidine kinase